MSCVTSVLFRLWPRLGCNSFHLLAEEICALLLFFLSAFAGIGLIPPPSHPNFPLFLLFLFSSLGFFLLLPPLPPHPPLNNKNVHFRSSFLPYGDTEWPPLCLQPGSKCYKKIIRGAAVCIQTLRALRNPPTCHSFAALSVSQSDTALEKTGSKAFSFPLWNNKQVSVEGQGSRGCHSSGLGGGGTGLPSAPRVGTLRWPPELRGRADWEKRRKPGGDFQGGTSVGEVRGRLGSTWTNSRPSPPPRPLKKKKRRGKKKVQSEGIGLGRGEFQNLEQPPAYFLFLLSGDFHGKTTFGGHMSVSFTQSRMSPLLHTLEIAFPSSGCFSCPAPCVS